jgi:glycosyltransferase involved in cell wall biosynthesis
MLDILIPTYNRKPQVLNLVNQILKSGFNPSNIIVVDSSDDINFDLRNHDKVLYLRSSFKAQPYQRYVALLAAKSEFVMFLDDDLEVLNDRVFQEVLDTFLTNQEIVGVTAKVDYHGGLFVQNSIKTMSRFLGPFKNVFQKISLNNNPTPGKINVVGNGGGYTIGNEYVQYFPGPNMSFRKEICLKLFDEILFAAYVRKIGKGEDKYLSMKANQFGKLYCLGELTHFYHPPIESSYNSKLVEFQTKQNYSRYLLIKQYLQTFRKNDFLAIPIFFWYSGMRLIGSLNNFNRFKGILIGTKHVILFGLNCKRMYPSSYFFETAKKDSKGESH